jgi:hypothetical protein
MSVYQADNETWIYFDGLVKHTGLSESEAWQMSREQDYITAARASNRKIWDGINELIAAQREWGALDYGNTLDAGEGANAGIAAADVGAVVFDTANALVAVLNAGHATNMARLL